jgi:hypothetical protein
MSDVRCSMSDIGKRKTMPDVRCPMSDDGKRCPMFDVRYRKTENEKRKLNQTFTYLCAATTRPSTYVKASKNIRSNGCF